MKHSFYGLLGSVGAAALVIGSAACGGGDGDGTGGTGGSGATSSGNPCVPTEASCFAAAPDGPGSECLALHDNTGADEATLRVRGLETTGPAGLVTPFFQDSVLRPAITINQPECNQSGEARYNWMFAFDFVNNMVRSGGGPPQSIIGAPKDGSCFDDFVASGVTVNAPSTPFTMSENSDGTLDLNMVFDDPANPATIAIYIDDTLDNFALLPTVRIEYNFTMSADHNCVGVFDPSNLSPTSGCAPASGERPWDMTAGSFDGVITVEQADEVRIDTLDQSLCVLLSQDTARWKNTADGKCAGSPGFMTTGGLPQGDWCSDNTSSCTDSWRLTGNIALAGFKINGTFDRSNQMCVP